MPRKVRAEGVAAQIGEGLVLWKGKKQKTKIRAKVIAEIALGGSGGQGAPGHPAKKCASAKESEGGILFLPQGARKEKTEGERERRRKW